ncbi:Protein YrdA [hydrothermal vent metagenome]|uniref:Protein YrdA n=1 Tax=hydrothermal vent metagenome TaxID=652676 RepID=A0A3B1B805_9ZZZZ
MTNIRTFEEMTPVIAEDVWVDDSAMVIGDVEIGSGSSIWPSVTVRGDIHRIRIGERTSIQDGSVVHVTHDSEFVPGGHATIIGSDITVGHNVILHGCEIQDKCLIGMGSIVLDGAVVQSQIIIGAGSLVPGGKVLESGYLYVGSPVKQIRQLTEKELAFFEYSAQSYQRLGQRHRQEAHCSGLEVGG